MKENIFNLFPFIETIKKYDKKKFKKDIIAGLTVAIIALPQSMAYAMIAGVNPKYGLYAAIIPVIISSLFGSSRFLISGPTNAISMVVTSTMATASIAGMAVSGMPEEQRIAVLFLLSFLVGVIQLTMGLARMGGLLNFISHSVVVGFTAGAGVLIGFNQLKNFFGLKLPATNEFIETVHLTFSHLLEMNKYAFGLGLFTVVFILVAKKISKKIPGPLSAMILAALIVWIFKLDSGTNLKLIGEIPGTLPPLSYFFFGLTEMKAMFTSAFAIAILGLVEALSIAKSLANKAGDKIDGSQEFVAQGLANIAASFFSAIPGSGSFTRSAVNFSAGAASRFSGVMSGVFVLVTLMVLAPYAKYIPIASLAGILIVIAYGMVDKKAIIFSWRATRSDRSVMIITFLATLFLELEVAVYVGVVLSIALFLKKVSHPQIYKVSPRPEDNKLMPCTDDCRGCMQILIFDIYGALFFGAIEELEEKISKIQSGSEKIIIIRMKGVRIVDATGAHSLERFMREAKNKGIKIIFTNVKETAYKTFVDSGIIKEIGEENIAKDTTEAIKYAIEKFVNKEECKGCKNRVFRECKI